MTHDQAFLQNVLDHPDDDAPRLLYADWLDEHGDSARAEFIRVQIQLARLSADDERRPALLGRELQLFNRWHKGFAGPLRSWVRRWEFRRGFVEGVTIRADAFLQRGNELFRSTPVHHVHLIAYADHAAVLAASPLLAPVRSLALTDPRFTQGQPGTWERGRGRVRGENPLGTDSLRTLLHSRHLTNLRSLEATNHFLGAAGARMLAACPLLDQFEALDLRNNDFAEGDVAAFVQSGRLAKLRRLRLAACFSFDHYGNFPEDDIGLLPPEIAPIVGQLEFLDLGSCGILLGGLGLLARQERFEPLFTLLLERSSLGRYREPPTADGFRDFIASPLFQGLHTLDLSSCYVEKDVAGVLANTPALAGLVHLGLGNNPIGPEGAEALADSPCLQRLQRLELAGSAGYWGERGGYRLGDDGVAKLAAARGLPRLAALDLRTNRITAEGVLTLAASALPARLYWLDLRHNALGNAGAAALLEADWPRLAWLDLRDTGLGPPAKQALRARFGPAVRY